MRHQESLTTERLRAGGPGALRSAVGAGRPVFVWAIGLVVALGTIRLAGPFDPFSPLFRYALEVAVVSAVGIGVVAAWWAARQGRTWDADLTPALTGAVAAFIVLGMLHGTPWGLNGIGGDAAFRTESITRFADSPASADFMQRGLPAFYAPAFFWVLGRAADLLGIEPWRMLKYATIVVTALVPLVTYLLWRWIVPARVAALVAIVPLAVQNTYEPYAWLVAVAIVPWWIVTVPGCGRDPARLPHPVVLGLIGGLLFMTYYYFFFAAAIATGVFLVAGVRGGALELRRRARPIAVSAVVAVLVAAPFWAPLAASLATATDVESWANRWFPDGAGEPVLSFISLDPIGGLSLAGVLWLVMNARRPLTRALLIFLAAAVGWYLIGLPAAITGAPILTFRIHPIITMILLIAGILAAARAAPIVLTWSKGARQTEAQAGILVLAAVVAFTAAHGFMTRFVKDNLTLVAHATPLPDGRLPENAPPDALPASVSANAIRDAIDERSAGRGHPVIVSTRADVLALNPYYGFVQWQVYYAHPASQFRARIAFLRSLASVESPQEFAQLVALNPFEPIDAFVLEDAGDTVVFRFRDDNFPYGAKLGLLAFPRSLFAPAAFDVVDLGDVVVAVRR